LKELKIDSYDQAIPLISDSISRERLIAANDASGYKPNVSLVGWLTVLVSAIATLLITIKSSMTPPTESTAPLSDQDSLKENWLANLDRFLKRQFLTKRGWYGMIGFAAMLLSATGTTLTTAKTFYDPTHNYIADQRELY